jgi:hypothetical protein
MDSKTKVYYFVSKIELDKLLEVLSECKDFCKELVRINDELITLIQGSSTVESLSEIGTNNIDK